MQPGFFRADVDNARANGALKKFGAVNEGRLRASFERGGQAVDQYLWSVVKGLDREWRGGRDSNPRPPA